MVRLLVAAPVLFLLVVFALSNPQHVRLGIWPTDFAIEAPLSIVILVAMAGAFLLGALMLWFGGDRRARAGAGAPSARRGCWTVRCASLQARLAVPTVRPAAERLPALTQG